MGMKCGGTVFSKQPHMNRATQPLRKKLAVNLNSKKTALEDLAD